MKISLRKANLLRADLESALSAIEDRIVTYGVASVEINILDGKYGETIELARNRFLQSVESYKAGAHFLSQIRQIIGRANVKAGVNDLLASRNGLDKTLRVVGVVTQYPAADSRNLASKVEFARTQLSKDTTSRVRETISTSVLEEGDLVSLKENYRLLKAGIRELDEEILEKNAKTTVEIPDEIQSFMATVSA